MNSDLEMHHPTLCNGELNINDRRTMISMNYVLGKPSVAVGGLNSGPLYVNGIIPSIKINKRLNSDYMPFMHNELCELNCCILTAVPYGRNEEELAFHAHELADGLEEYLEEQQAVGISLADEVVGPDKSHYLVHMYMRSAVTEHLLSEVCPDWHCSIDNQVYLVILIALVEPQYMN